MSQLKTPVTAGWFFTSHQSYKPCRLSSAEKVDVAKNFLERDRELIGMVRSRGLAIYAAVVIGATNLTVTFFDAPGQDILAPDAVRHQQFSNAVLLLLNPNGNVVETATQERETILSTPILARAVRVLSPSEMAEIEAHAIAMA